MDNNLFLDMNKLVFVVGQPSVRPLCKGVFDSSDKQFMFLMLDRSLPSDAFQNTSSPGRGILRRDWIDNMINKRAQMIIAIFNCFDQFEQNEKWEDRVTIILRKLTKITAVLRAGGVEEEVILKVVVVTERSQNTVLVQEKLFPALKYYEKDVLVFSVEGVQRELSGCKGLWEGQLAKNYEGKYVKLGRRMKDSMHEKAMGMQIKLALISQVIQRGDVRKDYAQAYAQLKFLFDDTKKKQFDFNRFLDIREQRFIGDFLFIRSIKLKLYAFKELPSKIVLHLRIFQLTKQQYLLNPFFFYEELKWKIHLIEKMLEVLYSCDSIELIPRSCLAEYITSLLTYYHKISSIDEGQFLIDGEYVEEKTPIYIGRFGYEEGTKSQSIIYSQLKALVQHRKDYALKGVQTIVRYKSLFGPNIQNFFNIFLLRFYLLQGKYSSMVSVFRQITAVELKRSNYFLLNQLLKQMQEGLSTIIQQQKVLYYATLCLLCDFFMQPHQLNPYLSNLLSASKQVEGVPNVFDLKKNSSVWLVQVTISSQLVPPSCSLPMHFHMKLNKNLHLTPLIFIITMNQREMVIETALEVCSQEVEVEVIIQPLKYVERECILQIESVSLRHSGLIFRLGGNCIQYSKYDKILLPSQIRQPQIIIENVQSVYYLHEVAPLRISLKDSVVSAKYEIKEEDKETEVYDSLQNRINMTNSKCVYSLQDTAELWLKCNRLGNRVITLNFVVVVEVRRGERVVRQTFTINKVLAFAVEHAFITSWKFKQLQSGHELYGVSIPINKKILLIFSVYCNLPLHIHEVGQQNIQRKITYFKTIREGAHVVREGELYHYNTIFETDVECEEEMPLTKIFIKWSRIEHRVQNTFITEAIKISHRQDKVVVRVVEPGEVVKKQTFDIGFEVQNIRNVKVAVGVKFAVISDFLLLIGEKHKAEVLAPFQKLTLGFQCVAIEAGVHKMPPVSLVVDHVEQSKSLLENYMIYVN